MLNKFPTALALVASSFVLSTGVFVVFRMKKLSGDLLGCWGADRLARSKPTDCAAHGSLYAHGRHGTPHELAGLGAWTLFADPTNLYKIQRDVGVPNKYTPMVCNGSGAAQLTNTMANVFQA